MTNDKQYTPQERHLIKQVRHMQKLHGNKSWVITVYSTGDRTYFWNGVPSGVFKGQLTGDKK